MVTFFLIFLSNFKIARVVAVSIIVANAPPCTVLLKLQIYYGTLNFNRRYFGKSGVNFFYLSSYSLQFAKNTSSNVPLNFGWLINKSNIFGKFLIAINCMYYYLEIN